jgi:hypothetical protein
LGGFFFLILLLVSLVLSWLTYIFTLCGDHDVITVCCLIKYIVTLKKKQRRDLRLMRVEN